MVTHIGKKFSSHTYYITPMNLNWFSWQQPTTDSLRQFCLKSLLHFSNFQTIVNMEMKLCVHVYFIVSMTTINEKYPQALFPITASSLLKLANHAMHGGTHVYLSISMTTIVRHFLLYLLFHFSNLHTIQCMEVKLGMHVYFSVSMTTMNKKCPWALLHVTTSSLFKLANHTDETSSQVYLSVP